MAASAFPDIRAHLTELLATALSRVAPDATDSAIVLERPKQAQYGDFATSLALQLAKPLKARPRDVAQQLLAALPASPDVDRTEIAGPGFINIFLKPAFKQTLVNHIIRQGPAYGRMPARQRGKVQVEFVSANPTGPLHVGHGRGAAYGASLANVLEAAGFDVMREYYVNDAGRQMDILALSTWLRYLELAGCQVPFPNNAYQGDYVRAMAQQLSATHGERLLHDSAAVTDGAPEAASDPEGRLDHLISNAKRLLGPDYATVHQFALERQLADCRDDLAEFGVTFDNWFSERSLYDSGRVAEVVRRLEDGGHIYLDDGAKWFRSTAFGDEKDRVVQRENGSFTYFASDIAYHLDKSERGFKRMIDVWGADHHGYIARVKGALSALGLDAADLTVAMVQFAVLYRNGQKIAMSTRAGEFVTLRELRQEVGNDAARFFYVLRKSDQHLDFDLDLAKSQSYDNPVYYIQYAHARVCSVFEQWGGEPAQLATAHTDTLTLPAEAALLTRLMRYPEALENAARDLTPHLVAFYLTELAGEFHSYYNATRILAADEATRLARLALSAAVKQVLANGLALLGVSAPEKM
jgi:arginyl-tRNA synthetase